MNQQLEIDWGEERPFSLPQESLPADTSGVDDSGSLESAVEIESGIEEAEKTEASATRRIRQLERALDQCEIYINELKGQLVDQAFLEAQLAATEEFSHIQKQAIMTLKGQQSEPLNQAELEELHQENLALVAQLETVVVQSEHQTSEIEGLQDQLRQERLALQTMQEEAERLSTQRQLSQDAVVQETQQRIIAQTTADRLRTSLRDREATIQSLETQLKQAHTTVAEQQEIIGALKTTSQRDSHKNQAIQDLSSTLLKAQTKIAELEAKLSSAGIVQAQFQHSAQEYEAKAHDLQGRSEELEQQVAEMQEQILQQAQQASEYETAVQHWKDRCLESEQTMAQMKQVLEHLLCDRNDAESLSEHQLEDAIAEIAATLPEPKLAEAGSRKNPMLDLPSIMTRWRGPKA